MKKVKYIQSINGRDFQARHDDVIKVHSLDDLRMWEYPSRLEEVYGHCSDVKMSAWYRWNEWVREYNDTSATISVTSHTCMFFTLTMIVKDVTTQTWWYCVATGRNNYATRIIIE